MEHERLIGAGLTAGGRALGPGLVAGVLVLVGVAAAEDRPGFDAEATRFAAALRASGEPGLAALEAWQPGVSPPGALADIARRVGALPLGAEALPRVAALVGSQDPFVQEGGLVVARGVVEQGLVPDAAAALEAAAAEAVRAPGVDPWVVLAAVELLDAAPDGPLPELLGALARAAARGPAAHDPARPGPAGSRMKPVAGEAYARVDASLGRWLGRAGAADAALLAHLERRHGTQGLEATRRAVALEDALRRVHLALSMGDRGAAAWALDQARRHAGQERAAEVERLAPLVATEGADAEPGRER